MRTTFEIGDITIHRVVEAEESWAPATEFMPNLTAEILEENRAWLTPSALTSDGRVILCYQSYLIRTPHHTVLVDSCNGNHKSRPNRPEWSMKTDDVYMRNLAATGVSVAEIDFVMCTHLHYDHVGWNTKLENGRWVPTFPNARYVFSETELNFWTERSAEKPLDYMIDSVLPIVAAGRAELVSSSAALDDHIRLLPTPGHTVDHFAVAVGRGRDVAVLTGDLIHSPLQMRYPDLTMRRDFDPAQGVATRRGFLERYCDTDTLCCTSHFPSPSAGHITRWGDGFRCDMISD